MTRRQLPIGIQSFRRIREHGCYYADKYRNRKEPIHRIGVVFSRDRHLTTVEVVAD